MQDVKQFITDTLGMTEKTAASDWPDPMVRAVELFARNLTITVDKKSSVIGLEFTNPDQERFG